MSRFVDGSLVPFFSATRFRGQGMWEEKEDDNNV